MGMLIIPLFIIVLLSGCSTSIKRGFFIANHEDYNETNQYDLGFEAKSYHDDEIIYHFKENKAQLFFISEYQYDLFNQLKIKNLDILYEKEVELVFLSNNQEISDVINYETIKNLTDKLIIFDITYDISKNLMMNLTNQLDYENITLTMENYFQKFYQAERLIKVGEKEELLDSVKSALDNNQKIIFPIWDYQINDFEKMTNNEFKVVRLEEAYYSKKLLVGKNLSVSDKKQITNQESVLFENGYQKATNQLINNYDKFELSFFNIIKRWSKSVEKEEFLVDPASFEGIIINFIIFLFALGFLIFVFQTSKKNLTTTYYLIGIFLIVYSIFHEILPNMTSNYTLFHIFKYISAVIRIYAFYFLFKSIYTMRYNEKFSWKMDLLLNIVNIGLIIIIFLNPFHHLFLISDNYAHKLSYQHGPIFYVMLGLLVFYIIGILILLRLQAKTKIKKIRVYLFYGLLLVLVLYNVLFNTGHIKKLVLEYSIQILIIVLGLTYTLRKFHFLKDIDDPFDFFHKINVSVGILDYDLNITETSPDFQKKIQKDFLTIEEYQYLIINRRKIIQTAPGFELKPDNYYRLNIANEKHDIVIMFEDVTSSYREIVILSEEIDELRQLNSLISSQLNQAESIAKENELKNYNQLIINNLVPFFTICYNEFEKIISNDDNWQNELKKIGFLVAKNNLSFRKSLWVYQEKLINRFQATNLLEKLVNIYYDEGYEVYFEGRFLKNINPKEVDLAFETIFNHLEKIDLKINQPTLFRLVFENKNYLIKIITIEDERMLLKREVKL